MTLDKPHSDLPEDVLFGTSAETKRIKSWVLRAASADVPVLLLGESGTGKEVMARVLHTYSQRSSQPLTKVNCPAIPGTLLESEIFGYERGAFTGAYESKAGLVEAAENGTLFLDEIAEMDPSLQAKLLQLLQDGTYVRIGGQEEKRANVRIICATNRRLSDEVQRGAFRRDLFYRINVITVEMPPLRQRREDIPTLVAHFLKLQQEQYGTVERTISPCLMRLFLQYDWPGNIRQLENLIKRYVILESEESVAASLLGDDRLIRTDGGTSLKTLTKSATRELERKIILSVLYHNNWNRKRAAEVLSISYRTLFYKLKDAGVPQKRRRRSQPALPADTCPAGVEESQNS